VRGITHAVAAPSHDPTFHNTCGVVRGLQVVPARLSICEDTFCGRHFDNLWPPNPAFGSTRSARSAYQ